MYNKLVFHVSHARNRIRWKYLALSHARMRISDGMDCRNCTDGHRLILQVPWKHVISSEMACRSLRSGEYHWMAWTVMIFGLEPTENSWHRYSRFCIRNQAHLAEAQSSTRKGKGRLDSTRLDSNRRGAARRRHVGNARWKRGEENRQRFSQNYSRAALVRAGKPKIALSACGRPPFLKTLRRAFALSRAAQNANAHLYLRKRDFGIPSGLAALFDLKFPAHLAVSLVCTPV